jgi:thiopeptide-type bacteriocin biosynthesis protein
MSAPNLCRFIALIQADGLRGAMFEIGPGDTMPYTPRIRRGRVILHPRTWRFDRSIFGETLQSVANAFRTLRDRWDAPRYVLLCESDNRLLLDLDSPISAEIFLEQSVKGRLEFREVPAMPGELVIGGEGGGHCSELIIQAVREPLAAPERRAITVVEPRVTYAPGSQWAYAKLYITKPATDVFLSRDLASFAASLEQRGLIDRCFFLRYADPAPHVRLRVHARADCSAQVHDALLRAIEGWKSSGTISAAALATYDPEYERYNGTNGIEAAEAFFDYDSRLCFAALADNLSSTRAQIEYAAATFDPLIAASEEISALVLRVYATIAQRKMDAGDRDTLRRLTVSTQRDESGARILEHALAGDGAEARLMSLLHMHCNRMGLDHDAERRAAMLLRAAALARNARRSAEKSPKEMARI